MSLDPQQYEELVREIRKQGRASIAAQAAAESCLAGVRSLHDAWAASSAPKPEAERDADPTAVVRALLPLLDALDRSVARAELLSAPRPEAPPRGLFARLRALTPGSAPEHGASSTRPDAGVLELAAAVRVLQGQLEGVLGDLGVELDRAAGVAFDPARHRAVEHSGGAGQATVRAVLRAGVSVRGRRLREAEVATSG